MRIFRKGVKRGIIVLVEKFFNLTVVLALLLQPVGTVGLYGAFSFGRSVAVAADEEPMTTPAAEVVVPEEKAEAVSETPAPPVEPEVKPTSEVVVPPAPETTEPETPATLEEQPSVPEAVPPVVSDPAPITEPASDATPTVPEEGLPAAAPADPLTVTTPVVPDDGVQEAPEALWQQSADGKKVTTSQAVELGVTYVAPQNDQVTVTFTRLPEHAGTLSLEEVKLSDEQMAALGAFSHTAYDVTSSMKDGTFAYTLTLPIPKDQKNVKVKYAEDARALNRAREVADQDTDTHRDSVSVDLDHFTLFVATYGDVSFSVEKSEYIPGDTVYVKTTGLNDTKFYKLMINPPGAELPFAITSCFDPTPDNTILSGSYVLPLDSVISSGWAGELKEYVNGNCTSVTTTADPFSVVTPPPATGDLKAIKVVDDQSDLTQWSFQLDNDAPVAADASGVVDFGQVLTGEHTITESGPAPYTLASVSGTGCSLVADTAGATAQVADNGMTVCTFSNAVDKGSITIVKDAVPNDTQDFTFTTTGLETTSFVLDDDGDTGNDVSNTQTFSALLPGTYSFTEAAVPGWELQGMNCVTAQASLDLPADPTATLTLMPGENVTCTYTNVKLPYCGDGIVNQAAEECDGAVDAIGVSCSQDCHLVPNPGVLHVTKVVINDNGGNAVPADFSFSLNGDTPVPFEADGTNDVTLDPGTYAVTEPAPLGYTVSYSKGCDSIDLFAGGDASCTITNDDAPVTVVASKIICTTEADLPNWGNGGPDITATTAADWVETHPNCQLKRDWPFQWSSDGVGNPGDNTGGAGAGWHTFVGNDTVPIVSGPDEQNIWVREVWNDGYIPFTYGNNPEDVNGDNVSAELYCHHDVVNYDNWDKITNPVAGEMYFCVGWNVEQPGKIIVQKQTDPAGSPQSFTFHSNFSDGNFSLIDGETYESGALTSGTYSVSETPLTGWREESATCSDGSPVDAIMLDPGETVTCVFKNQQTAHIVATKIVCDTEADLPNYGLGGPDMTETSATDWVNTHEGCHFQKDWQFQWAYYSDANPGNNTGASLDPVWHTFGPTGVNGQTSTDVDLKSSPMVWVREVWNDGYIPFTYGNNPEDVNGDNVSAEFYCHHDVVNYDNYDYIDASENAPAYYCVAWNVAKRGTITIVKDAAPQDPQDFQFTGDLGQFLLDDDGESENGLSNTKTFTDLLPGTYTVSEILPEGWQFAGAACVYDDQSVGVNVENGKEIVLGAGADVVCTFHNNKNPVTVVASKIVCDVEADLPNYGEGGPDITATTAEDWVETHESCRLEPNWQFQWSLDNVGNPGDNSGESGSADWHTFGPTGIDGTTTVNIPEPGTSRLWFREVLKEGYIPFTRDENNDNSNNVTAEFYCNNDVVNYDNWDWIDTEANHTYYCVAWNAPQQEQLVPRLLLTKANDSTSDETPGNEVVYTLTVTAPDGPVDGVTVTDLPPDGFVYEPGSGSGAPFIHEYASPGIWNVGNMSAGETRTLTYRTIISTTEDAGLYKDLAYAKGVSGSETIFANSASDPFVGTDVNVVLPEEQTVALPEVKDNERVIKRKTKTQYVLGAATTLPSTGATAGPLALALGGLVLGAGLLLLSRRRSAMLFPAFLIMAGLAFLSPSQASAANLSVKIETPEATVASPDFQIGFVTLDVLARPLSVECYVEGVIAPFATMVLDSTHGGNSGSCQINGSVMPTDGNYAVYVKAIASGEGSETVESTHETVTLASSVPGTPYSYSRSDGACQNTITFMTADDGGKTVKVELYRSASATFTADASTKVDEQALGSNVAGSFIEATPSCDNGVFYALRAVDVLGNGSAFVGDTHVTVHKYTVTHHKTKTVTQSGGVTTAPAIAVVPAANVAPQAGEVQGAETTTPTTPELVGTEREASKGSVLGEATTVEGMTNGGWLGMVQSHPWWSALLLLAILALGFVGYQYSQKHYDHSGE